MISIILPTRNRPEKLKKVLSNITRATDIPYELITITDSDDPVSTALVPPENNIVVSPDHTAVPKWNTGARRAKYEWLMLASDDIVLPPKWASQVLATPNTGFIGIPDHIHSCRPYEPFFIARKTWLRRHQGGVFVVPHYKNWGVDLEVCARAILHDEYAVARVKIQHNHYLFSLSTLDSTYNRAEPNWDKDVALFHKRSKEKFPNDFEGYL